MSDAPKPGRARVAVVGGGLAGLACAGELLEHPAKFDVTLFEARNKPGGRAGAFVDGATGETLDLCQHVALGCCREFRRFVAKYDLDDEFTRDRTLHFLGPGGELCRFEAARWLPAPFHLACAFSKLRFLNWREKLSIARCMLRMRFEKTSRRRDDATFGAWLRARGATQRTIDLFWTPVVESALSERVERADYEPARKVFVDGFLATRDGYELLIPKRPLTEILEARLLPRLIESGLSYRPGTVIRAIARADDGSFKLKHSERIESFDRIVVAVPWNKVRTLLDAPLAARLPELDGLDRIPCAPIASVHLRFDVPITDLPHVVLPGRLSQWLFEANSNDDGSCYQVVISAAYDLMDRPREETVAAVVAELRAALPEARDATLLSGRVILEPRSVFAPRPGVDTLRPSNRTPVEGLYLAGDWTATGWPATMESAIRSGTNAAAETARDFVSLNT